ncbi:DMT family transporter [Desulfohalobium retbaense]|nr:DMT family transporter [Desulfohalobium retbaense]
MSSTLISLLSGLGGMFGWGIYDFFAGVYSKTIGPYKTFFWSQLAGLSFILLVFFLLGNPFPATLGALALLPIAAIFYSLGYIFFMKGFEIGNISIVAAIMNLWAVFTMLTAFLFMGQRLTPLQSLGVTMIICGAIFASLNWHGIDTGKRFQLSAGVKETILGAFFFGTFWNISEIISEQLGWLPTTLFVKIGIILFLLLLSYRSGQKLGLLTVDTRTKSMILLIGFIEAGAVALVNYGLTVGDAILITPIASALSVVTIALAVVLLKEKVSTLQGVGILTAVSGIIITGV